MHVFWIFLGNVAGHWVASMSGAISLGLAVWEFIRKKRVEGWTFFAISTIVAFNACNLAWQDEHRNSEVLVTEKLAISAERDFWKQQSYTKDSSLRSRDEILAKNYQALVGEQDTSNKLQSSIVELSGKIVDLTRPALLKWKPLALGMGNADLSKQVDWILLTNKPVSPVDLMFSCGPDIQSADARIVSALTTQKTVRLNLNTWESKISSPAWTPDSPIEVEVVGGLGGSGTCSFKLN